MQPAPIPADESLRLATLRALNVLDTPAEERFDRLTRLARKLFGVSAALVSLVDADRQWFKSAQGLDATETPREVSFCGHAILGDDIFLVPDATLDVRFADNPLVTGAPNVRFYAGCPLKAANGSKVGTLCLLDTRPRDFGDHERALLRDLAGMAEQELAAIELATTDALTSLSNRRGFEALAAHAIRLCRRLDRPATLMFFDLDDFKSINDRFGHAEGDQALINFGKLLRQVHRDSDVIARLGGDEFVVLMTDSDAFMTRAASGRLASIVNADNALQSRGYDLKFSVGMAEYVPTGHVDVAELVREADASMYHDKQARRRAG